MGQQWKRAEREQKHKAKRNTNYHLTSLNVPTRSDPQTSEERKKEGRKDINKERTDKQTKERKRERTNERTQEHEKERTK